MKNKTKYTNYKRLIDKMDAPIRDVEIRSMWEGLKYSDLKYNDKLKLLSGKYFVSEKVIEKAINETSKTK